jgi:PhnB protein
MSNHTQSEQFDKIVERLLGRSDARPSKAGVKRPFEAKLGPVVEVIRELRDLPRAEFKARLKSDLQRRATMASTSQALTAAGTSATPYLSVKGAAAAIEFYKKAFGATELMRLMQPDGRVGHAQLDIGGAKIMLADEFPEFGLRGPESFGGSPIRIHLDVPDVDAMARRAIAAGATVDRPVADQFYGARSGQFRDPFGYTWNISTYKETLSPEEMQRRINEMSAQPNESAPQRESQPTGTYIRQGFHSITPYLIVPEAGRLIDFAVSVFGAKEQFRINRPGGNVIMHAEIQIGDSMIELADANAQFPPTPATLILRVDDVDAAFLRATEAGATVLQPVADQEYGVRSGSVVDASGNRWSVFKPAEGNVTFRDYRTVTPHFNPLRAPAMIEFLQRAFGAEEVYRAQSPDGVVHHAQVRIGDSLIGMGDAHGPYQPTPATLHLYVPDADAVYDRAMKAGATSIQPVADQPYGDRSGGVTDPFGNRWFIATHLRDVAP